MQRLTCVEGRGQRDLSGIERHRHGQRLEGRTHFEHAGGQPVDAVGIERFLRVVRIVVRHRHHRDHFAAAHIGDETGGGDLHFVFLLGGEQFVAQSMLHAKVDRELDRFLRPVGGKARHVQVSEAARIQPFFDAGDALVVDIDVADDMRNHRAVGIDTLVFG